MRLYLMPASGLNSNVVTTGPGLICVTCPWTSNSAYFAVKTCATHLQFILIHRLLFVGTVQQTSTAASPSCPQFSEESCSVQYPPRRRPAWLPATTTACRIQLRNPPRLRPPSCVQSRCAEPQRQPRPQLPAPSAALRPEDASTRPHPTFPAANCPHAPPPDAPAPAEP